MCGGLGDLHNEARIPGEAKRIPRNPGETKVDRFCGHG